MYIKVSSLGISFWIVSSDLEIFSPIPIQIPCDFDYSGFIASSDNPERQVFYFFLTLLICFQIVNV